MSPDPQHLPMFRIDVSADASSGRLESEMDTGDLIVALLRQLVANQDQQNQLLKELNHQLSAAQRQRAQELCQWKDANPDLAAVLPLCRGDTQPGPDPVPPEPHGRD